MSLYPNGDEERNRKEHISPYLVIAETNNLPPGWEVNVSFKLFVYDQIQDKYMTIQEKMRRLHGLKTEWGFTQLLPLNIFNDPSSGYLIHDTCMFGAEVFVMNYTGREECLSLLKELDSTYTYLGLLILRRLWLCPKGYSEEKDKFLSLFLALDNQENFPSEQKIFTKGSLCIRNQYHNQHREITGSYWISADSHCSTVGKRSMEKALEYLRRDKRNVLDKSGPKIIQHKPITALLSPTELDPYIPLHTASEDLIYTGIRNCCEILEKRHSKSIGSFPVSILRPFSEDFHCSEFNTLLKRMKHEKLKWDNSFNPKSSRKRKLDMPTNDRKTKNPSYSRARSSSSPIALEASSPQRMDNSRPLIAPSRSSYSVSDLLHLFEDMCNSQFKMRFSFEQVDSGPQFAYLAKLFPETMSISDWTGTSQPTVATKTPMDQFRTYLYSFLEDKDENMIQELFEGDGYELTALGRIRIKSVEIPSPTKSFDCSLNGSSESEDEFYDYTPLLDGTLTKMSKSPSANVAFSSPSNESSKLLEKDTQGTLFSLDHATLQNPWSTCGNHNLSHPPKSLQAVHQENTSDTLEETDEITSDTSEEAQILEDLFEANGVNKLFDKLEAPFAPSNLLLGTSSNEAATHIQKGLTISLQSMTDVNGMIVVANNVFMILKSLGVDFISFYEKVKIFLGCFVLKTQLADSLNLSTAEFEAQYYEKKLHFDKVFGEHEQFSASIIKPDEHIAGLNQRIIQTKELLKQLEEELSSTQAEHASFMCDFAQASESVSKSEEDVQTALNVLSQHKKKNGQHSVVERAFERAKASLNE
ncbi:unnamed protein product [Camellia sinensis]